MSNNKPGSLIISSSAFENEGIIPPKYTCDGEEINPPLHVENIPDGTILATCIHSLNHNQQ